MFQHYQYRYGTVNAETGVVDATKNNGQVGRLDAFIGGTAPANKQWEQRYTYDALGRLDIAREQRGDTGALAWRADYDYDRYGNRMQSGGQNVNLPYIPVTAADLNAERNRFTSGVTYDAAGQITVDGKFRGRQYLYDANGRMKWSAYTDGTGVATSVYDGLGQRVETSVGGVTRQHVYDAFGRVVAEYVISGAPQTGSTYKASYAVMDRQGSKRVVLNESGGVIARHDYYPFGEEIQAGTGMRTTGQFYGATDSVRQRYAQTERDEGSGLEHTPWRKLEVLSGRWTSPDPYQGSMNKLSPQLMNRYTYVQNDPVNFVDPSGLCLAVKFMDMSTERTWWEFFLCRDGGGSGGGNISDIDRNRGGGGSRPDLPDYARSVYIGELGEKLTECINKVFSKVITGRNGVTATGANLLEPQRLRNAPLVDDKSFTMFVLGGGTGRLAFGASFHGDERRFGPNGTLYIASDIPDWRDPTTGRTVTSFELKQRTYVHELGNLLSRRISPDGSAQTFGASGGIKHATDPEKEPDTDTGANLEDCVFGNMYP